MTTATFQQGVSSYTGCKFMGMWSFDNNYTFHDTAIWAGRHTAADKLYRGLLAFNISSIPSTATITAVTLVLTFVAESNATDRDVVLYKMLKDWNEPSTTQTPASDVANDPSWGFQYYDETAWGTAGAGGEDVDRDTNVAVSATITAAANTAITFTFDADMIALVQAWVDGSVANYGLQVAGDEVNDNATKQWASPTNATSSYRPLLTITYTEAGGAVNSKINIGDAWKTTSALKINIADSWKAVATKKINVGDAWKTIT